jgi:hypothetical protein
MNTRLKIDLNQGILEVEGTQDFVKMIYDEFKSQVPFEARRGGVFSGKKKRKQISGAGEGQEHHPRQKKKPASYSIVKDLDLSAKKNKQSLRDIFKLKSPSSNMEKNIVFTYYLQKIASVEGITPGHIYSCYKDVNMKVPGALEQSLLDTSHLKGWLDTSNLNDIKVATPGENFVEHDLPKEKK